MADAKEYWLVFCDSLGLGKDAADDMFAKLAYRYANPIRYYHILEGHIADCIDELNSARDLLINPIEAEAAVWAHDACYDTRSHTNEEESADWAVAFYKQANIVMDFDKLRGLILLTKHHQPNDDLDAAIVSDCDLAILGKSEKIFDEYEYNIRREYAWVPETVLREHRANFLDEFLKRDPVYHTAKFREKYERQARLNIARSIRSLKSTKPLL